MAAPQYEIYAVKYAHHDRSSRDNFVGGDSHDVPMPLDYFVWAIRGNGRTWVVDTGFSAEVARQRGREFIRCPGQGLSLLGIDPESVGDVIISHMHYDHAGNAQLFKRARYHLQDREMQFATGRCMCFKPMRFPFDVNDVKAMVDRVFEDRVCFHDGDEEIAPGLTLHRVGGHTMGLQVVRVHTRRGWVVLASDASHFYANIETDRPFPLIYNQADMHEAYRRVYSLASSPAHVIPGHDPLVMKRYPAPSEALRGVAVRLDADPIAA
ncbi:MAG: N-acyl homoserine lactonase family protein [Betaproteobacteria bacterium]|nr:N-acyl homoserine lactonase family protein [Betaproteobacteria bacterium]